MAKIGYHSAIIDAATGSGKQATITVYGVGTTDLAIIYSNIDGDSKGNPFETDDKGRFSLFTDSGIYDIQVSGTGITTYKLEGIPLIGLSMPPEGYCKVTNLYVNPVNRKLVYDWDDIPE